MFIDSFPPRVADARLPFVVLDTESEYDLDVHDRYLAAERFTDDDKVALHPRDAREDPRVHPRWPCQRITAMSWLILRDTSDGLVPERMETRGRPEQDEGQIIAAFLTDMQQLGPARLVTWGGFAADMPPIMLAAMAAGLTMPDSLSGLLSPWQRSRSGHIDLMSEISGGAARPHMAEVAAKLNIPCKLTCRPDLVSRLMTRGKWSDVKSVAEGDCLTLTAILMAWKHLGGAGASMLEGTRRLSKFVADHLGHRHYASTWIEHGEHALRDAFAREADKLAALAPHLAD
ncbi:hypothetical protein [Novosphingobium resinovorum]|uniref:Predicted 3'-5' exonuclease PolB-like domain-containing protein n=1 Tax=Novosphingobium resinovorum TaxID=158500 RepID=A0A1D8A310_9SPHN|nr:hypothetical protein [Novosphingobium resinovorum]AOR76450.1 hypothetical protein BES08_06570 [Novosphingobium resinovorum]